MKIEFFQQGFEKNIQISNFMKICPVAAELFHADRQTDIMKLLAILRKHPEMRGPGSSVGIATGYGLDGPGIESRWGARFSAPVQTGPGAHPASYTMGTGSFPG
jgi:hypothetical protein